MVHTVTREERLRSCSPGATHRGERHYAIRNGKEDKGVVYNDWSHYVICVQGLRCSVACTVCVLQDSSKQMSSHQE